MSNGIVTTARGSQLNMDELIHIGERKIKNDDKSTIDGPMYNENDNVKPEMRGFVPSAGKAVLQHNTPAKKPTISLNELTKVSVKSKQKAKTPEVATTKKSDDTLGDLLGKLEKPS